MQMRFHTLLFLGLILLGCGDQRASRTHNARTSEADDDHAAEASRHTRGTKRKAKRGATASEPEDVALLESLGYLSGVREATEASGVLLHDTLRTQPGHNLISSGHARALTLTDAKGRVTQTFELPAEHTKPRDPKWFRRGFMLPDGDVLAVLEGHAMVRFTPSGEVRWRVDARNHHDVVWTDNGTLLGLTRKSRTKKRGASIVEDRVTTWTPEGVLVGHLSVLDALLDSPFRDILTEAKRTTGDVLHTNSLEILDDRASHRHPAFQPGRLLLSLRAVSALVIIDPETEQVVWAHQGNYVRQHDARIVDDGLLMLFDNQAKQGPSAVRIYDPADMREVWTFEGSDAFPFHSRTCGIARRLPNGNVLVVESNEGRAFELTPDKELVWDFRSPWRAIGDRSMVSNLFDVVRIPEATTN